MYVWVMGVQYISREVAAKSREILQSLGRLVDMNEQGKNQPKRAEGATTARKLPE